MPPSLSKLFHGRRYNSPFSQEQANRIAFEFDEFKRLSDVRRAFHKKLLSQHPQHTLKLMAFQCLVEHFQSKGAVHPFAPQGERPTPDRNVSRVQEFFDDNPGAHVRSEAESL